MYGVSTEDWWLRASVGVMPVDREIFTISGPRSLGRDTFSIR